VEHFLCANGRFGCMHQLHLGIHSEFHHSSGGQ
jgi:hypothetical protein